MKNVSYTIENQILVIQVDLSKRFGPSKSGKTQIIATSEGIVALESGAQLGLNVFCRE